MTRVLPAVAAYAAGVQVCTLRQWVRRGHIPGPVDGLYDLEAIADYIDQRDDAGHYLRAVAGRRRRGEQRAS